MKTALMIAIALMIAAVSGCASARGGGVSSDEGFRITAPTFATSIKQGDTQTVTVSLQRDKYFKQEVKIEVTATDGIEVEPDEVDVEASQSPDVLLQITAPKDAALGEYQVRVVATPETGIPTSKSFMVKVVAP